MTSEAIHAVAYLFGGAFLANAVPHFVSGLMGHPFPSPFAKPPGRGLSSPTVNAVWGLLNFAIAYILLCRVGSFHLLSTPHVLAAGLGMLFTSLMLARHFGALHRGNSSIGTGALQ